MCNSKNTLLALTHSFATHFPFLLTVDIEQVFAYYGTAYAISVDGNLYAGAPYWRHPLQAIAIASAVSCKQTNTQTKTTNKQTKCKLKFLLVVIFMQARHIGAIRFRLLPLHPTVSCKQTNKQTNNQKQTNKQTNNQTN